MNEKQREFKNSLLSKIIFAMSISAAIFRYSTETIDYYATNLGGAIFEMLSIPMLGLLFFLPLISLFLLIHEGFSFKSLYLYTIALTLATTLFMFLRN